MGNFENGVVKKFMSARDQATYIKRSKQMGKLASDLAKMRKKAKGKELS